LASPGIRGSLVALQQLAITFGILISYWIAYGTSYIGGQGAGQTSAAWRIPLGLQIIPALVLMVGAVFLPFSPRWLMLRGREEECLLTLAKLRNLEPEDFAVQSEYMSLQAERLVEEDAMKERYGSKASWKVGALEYMRLVRNWPLCRRLLLAVAAQSLQQWTGINAISEFFALYERPLLIIYPVQSTMLLPVCLA
jgi:MFS family permease